MSGEYADEGQGPAKIRVGRRDACKASHLNSRTTAFRQCATEPRDRTSGALAFDSESVSTFVLSLFLARKPQSPARENHAFSHSKRSA